MQMKVVMVFFVQELHHRVSYICRYPCLKLLIINK